MENKISAGPVTGHSTPACGVSLRKQVCPQRAACLPRFHRPDCLVGIFWSCDSFSHKFTPKMAFSEVQRSLELSDGVDPSWLCSAEARGMSSSGFLLRTGLDVPYPQLGELTVVLLAREEGSAPFLGVGAPPRLWLSQEDRAVQLRVRDFEFSSCYLMPSGESGEARYIWRWDSLFVWVA